MNLNGFKQLAIDKKVSELFLGTFEINWEFLKVGYNAICTEALPLTFFEKMICGIANLDEKVYLNDLAHIMGLNIEDDYHNLKFQDKAETEILMETLRALKQFGMISIPDETFSYIELTTLGKEYYAQGRKFKQGQKKGFTMYYDLMTGEHECAKKNFEKLSVDGSVFDKELSIPYSDESFVKQYAEKQIPQYYSKVTGNSFTDISVVSREILYKKIIACVIYDSFIEKFRIDIVESGGLDRQYLTNFLNEESVFQKYFDEFSKEHSCSMSEKTRSQNEFEEEITKVQRDAEYEIFNNRPQNAVKLVSDYALTPSYMEIENIFNYLRLRIKNGDIKSAYIHIPSISHEDVNEINSLAAIPNINFYLTSGNVQDFDNRINDNIFVLRDTDKQSVEFCLDDVYYNSEYLVFKNGESPFEIEFLKKQDIDISHYWNEIRRKFAVQYLPIEIQKIFEVLNDDSENDTFKRLSELINVERFIRFESSYIESVGLNNEIEIINKTKNDKLSEIITDYTRKLIEQVEKLKNDTIIDSIDTLEKMDQVKKQLTAITDTKIPEELLPNSREIREEGIISALENIVKSFESRLEEREIYLRQELLPKSYVLDTNILVIFPDIMNYISKEDRIVLSGKVLDELDKLKNTLESKSRRNVRNAIRAISQKMMMADNVVLELADTKLLPEDFDRKNPDNMILSVALKFRDRNPFIITNDINFQNRATSLGIPYKTLEEIVPADVYKTIQQQIDYKSKTEPKAVAKKEPRDYAHSNHLQVDPAISMPKDLEDIITAAFNACKLNDQDVLVAQLVTQIKSLNPSFDTNFYGFPKFKKLCEAFPSIIQLYENESNALCIKLVSKNVLPQRNAEIKATRDSRTNRAKDDKMRTQLDNTRYVLLKQLVKRMISEEDPSSPIIDGDIRNEFLNMTKIPIKLNIVKQAREELGIPTAKIRKDNYQNNK